MDNDTVATIKREPAGTYVVRFPDGHLLRDASNVIRFGRSYAASDFCAYFGIAYRWAPEDWPGLL